MSASQDETASKKLAASLLDDFEPRWGCITVFDATVVRATRNRQMGIHPALLLATFLDPRFKSLFTIPDEQSQTDIHARVLELMKMSETERRDSAANVTETPMDEEKQNDEENADDEDDLFAAIEQEVDAAEADLQQVGGNDIIANACSDELKRYLKTKSLKARGIGNIINDPLFWWKQNQELFPILARLAF